MFTGPIYMYGLELLAPLYYNVYVKALHICMQYICIILHVGCMHILCYDPIQ